MSYQVGMDTIHLRPTRRLGHTEYCSNDSLRRRLKENGAGTFEEAWQIDLMFFTCDGPKPWKDLGRVTDMGHAEFLEGGVDRRAASACPFADPEEALAFDAVEEYGLPDFDELVSFYDELYRREQGKHPDQVFTGGYYQTIVSGAINVFGWEMLLEAAADLVRFEKVLDSIYRRSLYHYQAWAKTSAEVFICHDDMVWSEGPFLDPAFYRGAIFTRYAELWKPLREAGKKVLFCSDANWTMFLEDIAAAGADGFIFEPMVSLERAVELFGKTHCIVGSKVDCRTLTFGTKAQIQRQVDETLEIAFDCPGFMFAVGNHIPSNVPVENALFYYDYLSRNWSR